MEIIKVNPALLKQEGEVKSVVSQLFGAFKRDRGTAFEGLQKNAKEVILEHIPITPSQVNWCCVWNSPKDMHAKVMIVATINDKWAFVEFMDVVRKHPAIFRLEDLHV